MFPLYNYNDNTIYDDICNILINCVYYRFQYIRLVRLTAFSKLSRKNIFPATWTVKLLLWKPWKVYAYAYFTYYRMIYYFICCIIFTRYYGEKLTWGFFRLFTEESQKLFKAYEKFFTDDELYNRVDENKRIDKSRFNTSDYGLEGSFKKLDLD